MVLTIIIYPKINLLTKIKYMTLEILMIALGLIMILELILSSSWNYFYFKSGFPIFRKEIYNENHISKDSININELEYEFSKSVAPSIKFRKIADNEIGFREQIFQFSLFSYTPIMHGRIIIDEPFRQVRIKGQTNWYILTFPLVFLSFFPFSSSEVGFTSFNLVPVLFLLGVFVILYFIQATRFKKVAKLIKNMVDI